MQNSALQAARNIDTTNEFSRADASLLPSEQQFASEEAVLQNPVYPVDTTGKLVQGIGNIFGSLAGRNRTSANLFG